MVLKHSSVTPFSYILEKQLLNKSDLFTHRQLFNWLICVMILKISKFIIATVLKV